MVGNSAALSGGGTYSADLINSILYYNSAPTNANFTFVTVTTDRDGRPRIIGGLVDMGAYESAEGETAYGLPWAWLLQHGLATDGLADLSDTDQDGLNNRSGLSHIRRTALKRAREG